MVWNLGWIAHGSSWPRLIKYHLVESFVLSQPGVCDYADAIRRESKHGGYVERGYDGVVERCHPVAASQRGKAGQLILKEYRHATFKNQEVHRESDHGRWPSWILGRFNAGTRESRVLRLWSLRDGICQQMEASTCQSQNTRYSFAGCSIKVFVNNKKNLDGKRRSSWTISVMIANLNRNTKKLPFL